MSEDNISLEFNLAEPISFQIGDYVNDEIFGIFYISEEVVPPDYNYQTGAYKYSLRFDRDYILWGNKVFRLTRAGDNSLSTGITRGETTFTITDALEVHIQEIIRNLWSLGYFTIGGDGLFYCTYGYCIDGEHQMVLRRNVLTSGDIVYEFVEAPSWWRYTIPTFEGVKAAKSMATITYDGANILNSLTEAICKPYECEWWVMNNVLCLGKCEFGEKIDFRLSKDSEDDVINVEKMRPNRNNGEYANRLYVFGADKNIPDTYRKSFISKINLIDGIYYADTTKIIKRDYLDTIFYKWSNNLKSVEAGPMDNQFVLHYGPLSNYPYGGGTRFFHLSGAFSIICNHDYSGPTSGYVQLELYFKNDDTMPATSEYRWTKSQSFESVDPHQFRCEFSVKDEYLDTLDTFNNQMEVRVSMNVIFTQGVPVVTNYDISSALSFEESYVAPTLKCSTLDGKEFTILMSEYTDHTFKNFQVVEYPEGYSSFDEGFEYIILPSTTDYHGLLYAMIPSAWFTSPDGDINSNKILGEQRLELPIGTDYIGDDLPMQQVVEKVVVFDDIFPKCGLRICGLQAINKTIDWQTFADGSKIQDTAVNYFIALERITPDGDVPFPFNDIGGQTVDMRIPGEGLQIKFITPDEASKYGPANPSYSPQNMLCGLTFNVGIYESGSLVTFTDDATGRTMKGFQIERTSEYKTYLPNEVMKPTLGDTLVLSGWNPNYMSSLGLIDSAENELKQVGEDYKRVLEYDMFTFECSMMSDWASEKGVLGFGQRAWVFNKALPVDTDPDSPTYGLQVKDSRVIGYELKLDIPEDSPVYTIGETDAYSRIKALENKLNAQDRTGSSSGVIAGSSGGGGGGGLRVAWGEEPSTGTEVDLSVNNVTKRLLKTEALDFTEKKVGKQDDADFIMDINAMFPI